MRACVVRLRACAARRIPVRPTLRVWFLLPGRLVGILIVMSFILIVADIVKPISLS